MDQSVVAPYPEVSVFVTRNGIDDRIVEATEQRRQAVVPFVQLVDTFRIVEIGIVFVIGDGRRAPMMSCPSCSVAIRKVRLFRSY